MNANCNNQMEFTLRDNHIIRPGKVRRVRPSRAQWWFQRMREVVDAALEWQPPSNGRPEQLVIPGTQRMPSYQGAQQGW